MKLKGIGMTVTAVIEFTAEERTKLGSIRHDAEEFTLGQLDSLVASTEHLEEISNQLIKILIELNEAYIRMGQLKH
jgi:hypothetical protein